MFASNGLILLLRFACFSLVAGYSLDFGYVGLMS